MAIFYVVNLELEEIVKWFLLNDIFQFLLNTFDN